MWLAWEHSAHHHIDLTWSEQTLYISLKEIKQYDTHTHTHTHTHYTTSHSLTHSYVYLYSFFNITMSRLCQEGVLQNSDRSKVFQRIVVSVCDQSPKTHLNEISGSDKWSNALWSIFIFHLVHLHSKLQSPGLWGCNINKKGYISCWFVLYITVQTSLEPSACGLCQRWDIRTL